MTFFTFSTEMSTVMRNSSVIFWGGGRVVRFFFSPLTVELKQTLKEDLSSLAVSYHKHRLSHLLSLATNPGELAVSQYD